MRTDNCVCVGACLYVSISNIYRLCYNMTHVKFATIPLNGRPALVSRI